MIAGVNRVGKAIIMATGKATVTLRGRFTPGTKVGLYGRTGDFFSNTAELVDSGKVDKDGVVSFKGLEPGARLWVVDTDGVPRAVAVTAKVQPAEAKRLPATEVRKRLAQTRPADTRGVITGPRSTASGRVLGPMSGQPFADPRIGKATPKDEADPRVNTPRQEDMRDVEQRSATLTGVATPKDPDEKVPAPSQEDARDEEQQSATPLGTAAPIVEGAPSEGLRQEDAKGLEQRSATPTGVATPISDVQARESSVAKAALGDPSEASAKGAGADRVARSSRSAAARKAAATRKRNAAKAKRAAAAKKPAAKRPAKKK